MLFPFYVLAWLGLVLSVIIHGSALLGRMPLGRFAWMLHLGVFVVWIPTVIQSHKMADAGGYGDRWPLSMLNCPKWMKAMLVFFSAYAVVNFIIFIILTWNQEGEEEVSVVFRGFSGHWMIFYCAAAVTLHAAIFGRQKERAMFCPHGHPVDPGAEYCEQCGQRIPESEEEPGPQDWEFPFEGS